jgi:hypothetical protein
MACTIYRVENDDGVGPYSAGVGLSNCLGASGPGPRTDFWWLEWLSDADFARGQYPLDYISEFKFACPDYQSLVDWWGEAGLARLRRLGFKARALRVEWCLVSDSGLQVMYLPEKVISTGVARRAA